MFNYTDPFPDTMRKVVMPQFTNVIRKARQPSQWRTWRKRQIYAKLYIRTQPAKVATIKCSDFLKFHVSARRKYNGTMELHVSATFQKYRKYVILQNILPTELVKAKPGEPLAPIDKIARVCCALTNLSESIVPFD